MSSHDGQSKSPMLYFGGAIIAIALGVAFDSGSSDKAEDAPAAATTESSSTESSTESTSASDENIKPVGNVNVASSDSDAGAAARSGEDVYNASCIACHGSGAANSPKLEKADWDDRVSQGLDGLVAAAIDGKGGMPAKGGNPAITDAEIQNAVVYMTSKAGHDLSDQVKDSAPATDASVEKAPEANAAAATGEAPAVAEAPTEAAAPEAPAATEAPATEESAAAPEAPAAPAAPEAPAASAETAADAPAAPETAPTETAPAASETAPTEAAAPVAEATASIDGEKIYKSGCFSCHDNGVAGAPKPGDKAAWEARGDKEAMYVIAINGKGAMPAKGGNPALSDDEVKATVDWMLAQ